MASHSDTASQKSSKSNRSKRTGPRPNRQAQTKQGKTFYKGREKQISADKNPNQWASYDRAERVKLQMGRHSPLASQLDYTRKKASGVLSRKSLHNNQNEDAEIPKVNETLLDAQETDKILRVSKEQLAENPDEDDQKTTSKTQKNKKHKKKSEVFQIESANISLQDILGDDDQEDLQSVTGSMCAVPEVKLSETEERALEMFMPNSTRQQVTLQELIMKRVTKKEDDNISLLTPDKIIRRRIPKRVVGVYRDAGKVASKWRSGKLPKALKLIPQLADWEELLYVTNPDKWSPNVVYQMTRQFVSQANNAICQRYNNTVLLPRIRDNIAMTKKLDFHLYQALKKSLFKPQAFFRGLLLPLCQDECRARESVIIGGVMAKNSIPVIHSALAIYKLLELEYSGPVHYFLKTLLNKRYAMPMKVLDACVRHFKKFEDDPRQMPVIWNQTFLVFAERYKMALTKEQRYSLKKVLKRQFHHQLTPQIRKELFQNVQDKITSMDIDI